MSYNLPIFFSTPDGIQDIKIGNTNYTDFSSLPVPIPAELAEEFTGMVQARNVEVYRTDNFRVLNYGDTELFLVDPSGNTKTQGTLQINGNQIRSSSGTTAIELSGANVQLKGTVQITSTISSPSGTNNFGGNITATGSLVLGGTISASTKFFDIPHPTKQGMRLRHGTLEGPENAVFLRGRTFDAYIRLPDYWKELVDLNTITVLLTPTQEDQRVWSAVWDITPERIYVRNNQPFVEYTYLVIGTRKDVNPLEIEYAEA